MFAQLTPRERLGYVAFACIVLLIIGYVGEQHLQSQPNVILQNGISSSSTVGAEILVDVAGKVARPGVYPLSPDKRVKDAIEAAGGTLPNAELSSLNLAAKLEDGQKILVGSKEGSSAPVSVTVSPVENSESSHAQNEGRYAVKTAPASGSIHLNSANKTELCKLPGVGPSTAEKILDYRTSHHGFRSIDELMAVKGIGEKKLAKMRPFLRL